MPQQNLYAEFIRHFDHNEQIPTVNIYLCAFDFKTHINIVISHLNIALSNLHQCNVNLDKTICSTILLQTQFVGMCWTIKKKYVNLSFETCERDIPCKMWTCELGFQNIVLFSDWIKMLEPSSSEEEDDDLNTQNSFTTQVWLSKFTKDLQKLIHFQDSLSSGYKSGNSLLEPPGGNYMNIITRYHGNSYSYTLTFQITIKYAYFSHRRMTWKK